MKFKLHDKLLLRLQLVRGTSSSKSMNAQKDAKKMGLWSK